MKRKTIAFLGKKIKKFEFTVWGQKFSHFWNKREKIKRDEYTCSSAMFVLMSLTLDTGTFFRSLL